MKKLKKGDLIKLSNFVMLPFQNIKPDLRSFGVVIDDLPRTYKHVPNTGVQIALQWQTNWYLILSDCGLIEVHDEQMGRSL